MQKLFEIFDAFGIDDIKARRELFIRAAANYDGENVLFLILARDYIFDPTPAKRDALVNLFMAKPLKGHARDSVCINISSKARKNISLLLNDPKVMVIDGAGTHQQARRVRNKIKRGGLQPGGTGNYNLVTKALAIAAHDLVEEADCFKKGNDEFTFNPQAEQYVKSNQIPPVGRLQVNALRAYLGDQVNSLGLN